MLFSSAFLLIFFLLVPFITKRLVLKSPTVLGDLSISVFSHVLNLLLGKYVFRMLYFLGELTHSPLCNVPPYPLVVVFAPKSVRSNNNISAPAFF